MDNTLAYLILFFLAILTYRLVSAKKKPLPPHDGGNGDGDNPKPDNSPDK